MKFSSIFFYYKPYHKKQIIISLNVFEQDRFDQTAFFFSSVSFSVFFCIAYNVVEVVLIKIHQQVIYLNA